MIPDNTQWVNEQQSKPEPGKEVTIAVMRQAKAVSDGQGGLKWELAHPEQPIDLEQDVVYWLPPAK
jgi:hypothetical protein